MAILDALAIGARIRAAITGHERANPMRHGPASIRPEHLTADTPAVDEVLGYKADEPNRLAFVSKTPDGDNDKVRVSSDETAPSYLEDQLDVADGAHSLSTINPGADEIRRLAAVAAGVGQPGHISTGAQTLAGVKTFSSFPVTPSSAPTIDYQVANKKYVDDNAGGDNDLDPSPDSDHTANGLTATLTAGAALVFGNACYIGADGKMEKTDADAEATSRCVALCLATIAENATGSFLLQGFARDDSWNWTIGGKVYLSITAGALTQTAPSGTDDCVVVVGVALTADVLYFNPSVQAIVEHT